MAQIQHQFSGLIKCLNCGKNYKKKLERKKPVYVCSGFANYGKTFCDYLPLTEEDLVYTVTKHLEINHKRIDRELREYVRSIEVKGKGYTVYYKDGSKSIINSDSEYGVKVQY